MASTSIDGRQNRATELLRKGLAAGWFDVQRIAGELVVDERTLGLYVSGALPMPLERQLCFALFLIAHVPSQARRGHNLLGRIQAEIRFHSGQTQLPSTAPVPSHRSYLAELG